MATLAAVQALLTVLPGFTAYAGAGLTFMDASLIPQAVTEHPDDIWGDNADLGAALYVAHQYTLMARGGSGVVGGIISESEGPISRSYQGTYVLSAQADMMTTPYGAQWVQLSKRLCMGPIVVGA